MLKWVFMEIKEKNDIISRLTTSVNKYDIILRLSDELNNYKPEIEDSWSNIEHLVHCLDFNIANFHRYRWSIIKPGIVVLPFDSTWCNKLQYNKMKLKIVLDTIKQIRLCMSNHLKLIVSEDWTNYYYRFNENTKYNLEEALLLYINHVDFHVDYINRNIREYDMKYKK